MPRAGAINGSTGFWLGGVMSSEAKKYYDYAREYVRLAEETNSVETRNTLLELARVWMDAALIEERAAVRAHIGAHKAA